jgi:hypothetical protein
VSRIRQRLSRLEEQSRSRPQPVEAGGTAAEIREIDKDIRRLESEIAEERSRLTPSGLAREHEASEELERSLLRFGTLDEAIDWLEAEIERERTGGGG